MLVNGFSEKIGRQKLIFVDYIRLGLAAVIIKSTRIC